MRLTGNWFTLILFVAGLGISLLSTFYLIRPLYRYFYWEKTAGTIIGVVQKEDDDGISYHEKAVFTSPQGEQIEVVAVAGTDSEESVNKGTVTVYYNPEDPKQAAVFEYRQMLVGVMLPFGLLLIAMGWLLRSA